MKETTDLHDAEITTISYDKHAKKLCFYLDKEGEASKLIFHDVATWELSPFEEQNIIYNINEFTSAEIPIWLIQDFALTQNQLEELKNSMKKLFYIDSSIGLSGYIISTKFTKG